MAHGTRADLYAMYALIMRDPPLDLGRVEGVTGRPWTVWRGVCPDCGLQACACELSPQPPMPPYEPEDFG